MIDTLILSAEIASAFLFPLGQWGRLSFFNQQASIYPYEAAMAVSLILLLVKYRLRGFSGNRFRKQVTLLFISLAISFLFTLRSYSPYENGIGLLYLFRLIFYTVHFMYLGYHASIGKRFNKLLYREIAALIAVVIISSWLQYLLFPNLRPLLYQGWDPHLYRVFSFFFEPYLAGGAVGLSMFFLHFKWHPREIQIWLKWTIMAILFILIMLTFSRTVYAACLITIAVLLIQSKRPLLISGLVAAFIILAVIIPKPEGVGVQLFRTFSIEARLTNAKEGIALWLKQPVLGVGYNRIRYKKAELGLTSEFGSSHAAANYHSSFVTMLAAGGAVGFILYVWFLLGLMKVSKPSFYYVLFLSIISLGDNALLHPFMMYILFRMVILEMDQSSLV